MRRRQVMGDNNPLGKPNSPGAGKVVDPEGRIRVLCYRDGVSYKNQTTGETSLIRDRRRDRLKLLARRTGRAETWRDECPIADRAAAIGVTLKDPPKGKEPATARANRKNAHDREAAYIRTKPVIPPATYQPPADAPGDQIIDVSRALAFERKTGSVGLSTCTLCREIRLNATYIWEGTERQTRQRRMGDRVGLFAEKITPPRYGAMHQAESAMTPQVFPIVSRWQRGA